MNPEELDVEITDLSPDEAPSQEVGDITDFINSIQQQNFNQANKHFEDIIGDRLQDTLDQAKIRLAGQMFNDQPEEDDSDLDISDEELDELLADEEDED